MPLNSSPHIKICGISTPDILEHVIEHKVEYVGFVHFEPSPRHIDIEQMANLVALAQKRTKSVCLLVDPDNQTLNTIINDVKPDFIQLHGKESLTRVEEISKIIVTTKLIKALPVAHAQDLEQVPDFAKLVDLILLDSKPPKNATLPGGRGESFDWSLLSALDPTLSFMLSGGLTPQNICDAIQQTSPLGIDISSGVERTKGIKDSGLIDKLVHEARSCTNRPTIKGD